jgi:hypothetical protein
VTPITKKQRAPTTDLRSTFAIIGIYADVAELADALDLGSSTARCEGSSPFIRISRQRKGCSRLTAVNFYIVGFKSAIASQKAGKPVIPVWLDRIHQHLASRLAV